MYADPTATVEHDGLESLRRVPAPRLSHAGMAARPCISLAASAAASSSSLFLLLLLLLILLLVVVTGRPSVCPRGQPRGQIGVSGWAVAEGEPDFGEDRAAWSPYTHFLTHSPHRGLARFRCLPLSRSSPLIRRPTPTPLPLLLYLLL